MNIALIGLPGCGKTTLGKKLAETYGMAFFSVDEAVAQKEGCSISALFARRGEAYFRRCEAEAIALAAGLENTVIDTGGGAVQLPENAETLSRNALVVFVDRPVAEISATIETQARPLLKDGPGALEALAAARREGYLAAAQITVDGQGNAAEAFRRLCAATAPFVGGGCGVIGFPIGHTFSPVIQKAMFRAQNLPLDFAALRVPPPCLAGFMGLLRRGALRGCNVTLPHKQTVIPLLDEVDPLAAQCGAVNTVVSKNGRLCGYNTDIEALRLALERAGQSCAGRRVVVLGAGGAARAAVTMACMEKAADVHIAARDVQKSAALAQDAGQKTPGAGVRGGGFEQDALCAAAASCDLLINCTPLGMAGIERNFTDFGFLAQLPAHAFVCDLVYNPPETQLLRRARELGHGVLNGLSMLVCQALLAQEAFLGRPLAKEALYATALQALEKQKEGGAR